MMRFLFLVLFLFGTLSVSAETRVQPKPFLNLQDGETLVFLGDSITHQALYTQYFECFFYTRYPERRIRTHNAGVSGDKAADALARFDEDVAALKPDHVTVLLGMNDGQYESFSGETLETYQNGMKELLARITGTGATAIALSPTMFDHHQLALRQNDETFRFRDRPFDPGYNALLAYYATWLRQTASAEQIPFVNLWGTLNDLTFAMRSAQPDFSLIEDAIHPGAAGHFVMAAAIVERSRQERPGVSNIVLMPNGEGWTAGRNTGVTGITAPASGDEISFTFLAKALPWVVPATTSNYDLKWGPSAPARLGYDLTAAGHKLSRELLRIDGLPPGKYELRIDDHLVATFSDRQLGSKVELQNYLNTPQSKQALEVALLNQVKNDELVRPMRDLWAKVKALRRNPEKAADPDGNRADLMARIETLQEKIREVENQIYEINQPIPRRYHLRRIETDSGRD